MTQKPLTTTLSHLCLQQLVLTACSYEAEVKSSCPVTVVVIRSHSSRQCGPTESAVAHFRALPEAVLKVGSFSFYYVFGGGGGIVTVCKKQILLTGSRPVNFSMYLLDFQN